MKLNTWQFGAYLVALVSVAGGCTTYVHTDSPPSDRPAKVDVDIDAGKPGTKVDVDVNAGRSDGKVDVNINKEPGGGVDVDVKRTP